MKGRWGRYLVCEAVTLGIVRRYIDELKLPLPSLLDQRPAIKLRTASDPQTSSY